MSIEVAPQSDRSSCPTCKAVFRGGFLRCPRDGSLLSSEDRDPLVGTRLADRYVIESVLGEGGIGRVYGARHVMMSRRYAIKVPFGELAYDTKVRARFLHEAEATSRLQHPNVIGVVDVGETAEGLIYMAMDLAEGESLAEVLAREGPQPRARVLAILAQVADGLAHAHERGLVHRDLKPENMIVDVVGGRDRVRLVDFGIAILLDGDGGHRLTTEGIVLGTPHYMAPEQATNGEIDERTDVFALGLITYELLAGTLPFEGTPIEVARKNLGARVPRVSERVPGLQVDPLIEGLAQWMLQKRPEDRPQKVAEVAEVVRLIERDPAAAAARLGLGGVEEVEEQGVAPAVRDLPAPVAPKRPPQGAAPPHAEVLPAGDGVPTDRMGERGGRWRWLALALLLLGGAAIVVVATRGGGGSPGEVAAAAPADAAPAPAPPDAGPAPLDAEAAIATVEVDAAAAAPDAAPTTARRPDAGRRPPDAAVTTARRPPPDAAPAAPPDDEVPATASLTALYKQVSDQLNKLIADQGSAAALAFKRRFEQIQYTEAIRKPALRKEAMNQLRALSRDMSATRP